MKELARKTGKTGCDSSTNRTPPFIIIRNKRKLAGIAMGGCLAMLFLSSVVSAQSTFTLERSLGLTGTYMPGTTLDITVTLSLYTMESLTAIGLEEVVPAGWGYVGIRSGAVPAVQPIPGTSGLLEFAWFPLPVLPMTFTYQIAIPTGATGIQVITGQGLCRLSNSGEHRTASLFTVIPGEGSGQPHTADQNGDYRINLSELLRIIQFFNGGGLHCEPGTEDGFALGLGGTECSPHASDYAPQDWLINLSELLRIIQFYNMGVCYPCPDALTEDGFCNGLE